MKHPTDVTIIRIPFARMVSENAEGLAREWRGYLQAGDRKFVIDLGEVQAMDSSSIGCLMDFYKRVREAGGCIHLARVQPRIDTLLSIVKARDLFRMFPKVEDAIAAFDLG